MYACSSLCECVFVQLIVQLSVHVVSSILKFFFQKVKKETRERERKKTKFNIRNALQSIF